MGLIPDLSHPTEEPEWMDTRPYDPQTAERGLGFLERSNRFFGGTSVLTRRLEEWSADWTQGVPISLLDVGTGGADIPISLVRWARRKGWSFQITALERRPELADIARRNTQAFPEIKILEGDFSDLSVQQTFDYVTASLLLHHVPVGKRVQALHHLDKLAKKGLILSDLKRSLSAYWIVALWSTVDGDDWVSHDGPLSVRRAFRIAELERLAEESGLTYLKARAEPWFRVSLAGEKS